ncbi:hypothetical protein [Paenibacillus sp. Y412MC10]|nr:hypothetical protein [Paenibacillus sp. Y412MC10]
MGDVGEGVDEGNGRIFGEVEEVVVGEDRRIAMVYVVGEEVMRNGG